MATVLNTYTVEEIREEAQSNPNLPWSDQIEGLQNEFKDELSDVRYSIDHMKFILLIDLNKPKTRKAVGRMVHKLGFAARSGARAVFRLNRVEVVCNRGGFSQPMAVQNEYSGVAVLVNEMAFRKNRLNCLKRLTKNKNNSIELMREKAREIYNDIRTVVVGIQPLLLHCEAEVTRHIPGNVMIFAIEVEEENDSGNDGN